MNCQWNFFSPTNKMVEFGPSTLREMVFVHLCSFCLRIVTDFTFIGFTTYISKSKTKLLRIIQDKA